MVAPVASPVLEMSATHINLSEVVADEEEIKVKPMSSAHSKSNNSSVTPSFKKSVSQTMRKGNNNVRAPSKNDIDLAPISPPLLLSKSTSKAIVTPKTCFKTNIKSKKTFK